MSSNSGTGSTTPSNSGKGGFIPPSIGDLDAVFANYEFIALLGRGGMGAVYKARQKSLDRFVAIKILPPSLVLDGEETSFHFAERFQREARAMAKLSHPNIIAVYDFGQASDGQFYFVMEYIEGTDLQVLIQGGQLTTDHVAGWISQICDALQYAHAKGIVHRDIKPANIMITLEGQVKVADFGLAKLAGAGEVESKLTMTNMAMGTPDYVAPEALEMGVEVDHRADLYAVGVMLYEMLTGKVPRGAWKSPSTQIPGLDPRYDQLIERAMDADREDRHQQASEISATIYEISTTPSAPAAGGRRVMIVGKSEGASQRKSGTTPSAKDSTWSSPSNAKPKGKTSAMEVPPAKSKGPAGLIAGLAAGAVVIGLGIFFVFKPDPRPDGGTAETGGRSSVPTAGIGPVDGAFLREVAALPAIEQVELVGKKIAALNGHSVVAIPVFDSGKVKALKLERGSGATPDLSPLAALRDLHRLEILYVGVNDISFLKGLKNLNHFSVHNAGFRDISVLRDLPLTTLALKNGPGRDYSVIAGLPLTELDLEIGGVIDLSFLKGMPLTKLNIDRNPVIDLSPLRGLPLKELTCQFVPARDTEILRAIPTLTRINGKPAAEYLGAPEPGGGASQTGPSSEVLAFKGHLVESDHSQAPTEPTNLTATKEAPFINTLGMKFVPVPITGGPTDGKNVLFSIWEARRSDYQQFVSATKRDWQKNDWQMSGFVETPDHPAAAVSWEDATEFCVWLTKQERASGKIANDAVYRLPQDHEWSCAAGIGAKEDPVASPTTKSGKTEGYFWGPLWPPPQGVENYYGEEAQSVPFGGVAPLAGYRDPFPRTAPVGSFKPNERGLYDLGGNVGEWCEDKWGTNSAGAEFRVVRGGAWWKKYDNKEYFLNSWRTDHPRTARYGFDGFRVVLELPASRDAATDSAATPSTPVPAAPADPKQTLDLLALIDPKRDGLSGDWELVNGELHGNKANNDGFTRLALPFSPPAEYDFRIRFTRQSGNQGVAQHLVCAGHDAMWVMGGFSNTAWGLETVGGAKGNANPTTVTSGINNGQRYESLVKVRRDRVEVVVDGKLAVDYKTDGSDLSVNEKWTFSDPTKLGVGCQAPTIFHSIELIPVGDDAVVPAPVDPKIVALLPNYIKAITTGLTAAAPADKPAFEAELARLKNNAPLPDAAEDVKLPAELKRLRGILRAQMSLQTTPPAAPAIGTDKAQVLFNGSTLEGWIVGGDSASFEVEDGCIKAAGPKGNLIYVGRGAAPAWKDFDLSMKVKTANKGNSGVWIHCPAKASGESALGLEVQIYNVPSDVQQTGSLFKIAPVSTPLAQDDSWFDLSVTVRGLTVTVFIDGEKSNEWTQPANWTPPAGIPNARLGIGTIGLQSYGGETWIKDVRITLP